MEVVKILLAYGANVHDRNNVSTIYNTIVCYATLSSVMIVITFVIFVWLESMDGIAFSFLLWSY